MSPVSQTLSSCGRINFSAEWNRAGAWGDQAHGDRHWHHQILAFLDKLSLDTEGHGKIRRNKT